jgi:UDP-GlcNAc:undecaprenyl-phosphate GlcNAc-1-phosphate transferase
LGAIDYPDGKRKLHKRLIPLWGGVAVYLSLLIGLQVARHAAFATGPMLDNLSLLLALVAGLVCFFGAIDDYRHLNPRLKLLLQICAVVPIVACGCCVDRIVAFGQPIELGWFGVPLTIFWLVGCINALNLLDGMDGLASMVGVSTVSMMAIIGVNEGHPHVAVIAVVLGGSLCGFLAYNLPPATIFLGDSGSMVIGLVVGILGIEGSLKTSATLSITAPAVIMALPMFDTLLAVIRRKLTGQRFDAADRLHIHHRLLDRGLTPWQVLCILGALCLTTGAAATFASIFRNDALAWITAVSLAVLVIRLRLFGYYELSLVKHAVARGLAGISSRLFISRPGRNPLAAADLTALPCDAVWSILIEEVQAWNVSRMELVLSGPCAWPSRRSWSDPTLDSAAESVWSLAIAFRNRDGRCCELRAEVQDVSGPEFLYVTGLTRVLKVFGTRFGEELKADLPSPPRDGNRTDAGWDPQIQRRAA